MRTSNVIGFAAAAALLTSLQFGVAGAILSGKGAQPIQFPAQTQSQVQRSQHTLEPLVVVAQARTQ